MQLIMYADIFRSTKREVTAAFRAIEHDSVDMSLAVNEGKTKYVANSTDMRCMRFQIGAGNCTFDVVQEIVYLGSVVTSKMEIKRKITLANWSQ